MLLLMIAAFGATTAAAADAPESRTMEDARCYLAMRKLLEMDREEAQVAGRLGSTYFLGRIDGANPHVDFEALIDETAASLTNQDVMDLIGSCVVELKTRLDAVEEIGNPPVGEDEPVPTD